MDVSPYSFVYKPREIYLIHCLSWELLPPPKLKAWKQVKYYIWIHLKDLTELCSEPHTSKVRSLLTKHFAFSSQNLESATASLTRNSAKKKYGAVWASSSETKLFSAICVCTIEMHIKKICTVVSKYHHENNFLNIVKKKINHKEWSKKGQEQWTGKQIRVTFSKVIIYIIEAVTTMYLPI